MPVTHGGIPTWLATKITYIGFDIDKYYESKLSKYTNQKREDRQNRLKKKVAHYMLFTRNVLQIQLRKWIEMIQNLNL